jgi:hypothetical protein
LTAVAIALSTAGCSAGGSNQSAGHSAGTAAQPVQGGVAVDKAAGQPAEKPGAPAALTAESRSLIFTGTVTIRVRDVGRAASEATTLVTGAGGFIGGDDRTSDHERSQARLTIRVPSARFTDVVTALGKLGDEESRQLSTQDVTEQVTDLDARIATGQASLNRVRDLLGRAQAIGEIVSLESELSRREADLESLKARKRKLDDLTAMSTVTAVLLGPQAATSAPRSGFLAGLASGWDSFLASLRVALTVSGALLPWLLFLGVPAGLAVWLVRRGRRPRPVPEPAPSTAD